VVTTEGRRFKRYKHFLTVVISSIGSFAVGSAASGQTALFIYNNGTGTPAVGAYYPGQSFTF